MPEHVFLSSFPFPDIPHASRPWQVNCLLEEPEFKEECRRWDVNEIVFGPVWEIYEPMMRADFHLFDKYEYAHIDSENFNWPLTVFHGYADRMITEDWFVVGRRTLRALSSSSLCAAITCFHSKKNKRRFGFKRLSIDLILL